MIKLYQVFFSYSYFELLLYLISVNNSGCYKNSVVNSYNTQFILGENPTG